MGIMEYVSVTIWYLREAAIPWESPTSLFLQTSGNFPSKDLCILMRGWVCEKETVFFWEAKVPFGKPHRPFRNGPQDNSGGQA